MLKTIEGIFATGNIETPDGKTIQVNSHTPLEQGLFLQKIFDIVKPKRSLEVGLAHGISALFILEKHREYKSEPGSHLVIEAASWGGLAEHNMEKEGLRDLADIRFGYSHDLLPKLYYENTRIQYVYIDTTKLFDTIMQDFYFIDKMLDVNGVVIFDDCGGYWPGVQRVARFVNNLPHYKILDAHFNTPYTLKKKMAMGLLTFIFSLVPFKKKLYPSINFKSDAQLGLDYACIAFKKIDMDKRQWNWDEPI